MKVIGSIASPKKKRVYHRKECIYAKRIAPKNYMEMEHSRAVKYKYRICKCCAGLRGEVRAKQDKIKEWEKKYNIQITYDKKSDTLYVQSEIGFWKIFWREEREAYDLYHLNSYSKDMSVDQAARGPFHRQKDAKRQMELDELIKYIGDHDRAKEIMKVDYRQLPRTTKKQKKYYRQAENRARRESYRRMDALFAMIESEHPEYRELCKVAYSPS